MREEWKGVLDQSMGIKNTAAFWVFTCGSFWEKLFEWCFPPPEPFPKDDCQPKVFLPLSSHLTTVSDAIFTQLSVTVSWSLSNAWAITHTHTHTHTRLKSHNKQQKLIRLWVKLRKNTPSALLLFLMGGVTVCQNTGINIPCWIHTSGILSLQS